MGDPRWTNTNDTRKLLTHRQPGLESAHDFNTLQTETNRRREAEAEAAIKKPVEAVAPQPPSSVPPITPTVIDRFHKWGSTYVTVANLHLSGDDPIADPGAYHTITDGYAFAKRLANRFTTDYERVVVWVSGGRYIENLTFDDPRIDVVGIGRPTIEGVVTIAAACTKMLFDFFEVINPSTFEGDDPNDFAGLRVEAGVESGTHFSDIQIKRCLFHGPDTQIYLERWSDFEDCDCYSETNLSTGNPSVYIQFLLADEVPAQSKWTQFRDCRIAGEPFPGGVLAPTYFRKGFAIQLSAVDPNTGDWIPNIVTHASGVYFKNCVISGWTRNYAWNMIHDHCRHIEGDMLNETSGSIHHYCVCWSGEGFGPSANTWFNHCEFTARYCACIIDAGTVPGSWSSSNVYLHHIVHGGVNHANPPLLAGSDVIDGSNLVPPQPAPLGTVFASSYATAAPFVYGAAGVENAVISMVTTTANVLIFTDFWEDT